MSEIPLAPEAKGIVRAGEDEPGTAASRSARAWGVTYDVLVVVALPLALVTTIAALTGWERPRYAWREVFPVTPLGLLSGGWRLLEGVPSRCELGGLRPFAAVGYAAAFFATFCLEAPFYALALGRRGVARTARMLAWGNVATHPLVFFGLPCLIPHYRVFALSAEVLAPAVEILLVLAMTRDGKGPKAAAVVGWITLANLISWQLGIVAYL